jgi:hypothetical protein
MVSKASLVITTVAAPNDVMKTLAQRCVKESMELVIIGDAASPPDFTLAGCRFYSLSDQKSCLSV